MAKKPDLFARFALDYADHPKIVALSDAAFRAHVTFILYSRKYKTDGIIKNPVANRLALQWDSDVLSELQINDDESPSLQKLENGDYYITGYEEMQETRAEIEERRRINAANGAKGGRPKGSKNKPKETQSVSESLTEPGTQNKAETETETELYISSTANSKDTTEAAFNEWYKNYPRKEGKGQARKAFKTALKKTDLKTLQAGLEKYNSTIEGKDKQFIAMPATWLNGERWDDDYSEQTTGDDSWNKLMNWTEQN